MGWRVWLGGNGRRGRVVRTRTKDAGSGAGPGAGRDGAAGEGSVVVAAVDMVVWWGDGYWVKMLGKAGYG